MKGGETPGVNLDYHSQTFQNALRECSKLQNFKTTLDVDGLACETTLEKYRKSELARCPFRWNSEATSSFVDATKIASVDCGRAALQFAVIQSRILNVADTGN